MRRLGCILLFAAPVLAEDFETRYHEAYKLEVVDGKVADAAARYLDLLKAKDLPAHLRAQSEFRFAVTCALLGRPDEARARLAALAAEPDLPAALRPQVEEYRKALADVAPGSAAAKRIDELVFQLGREPADGMTQPGVYRDFEIMGTAAVPHLRGLLDHPDRQLREHAFRILCRMNQPGLAPLWDPGWESTVRDFADFLRTSPAAVPAVEARLKALPPCPGDEILYRGGELSWSADFLKARAAKGAEPEYVAFAVARRQDREENRAILRSWLADGPDAYALEAALLVAGNLAREEYRRKEFEKALFSAICLRLLGVGLDDTRYNGLIAAAAEQPTGALLDLLAKVLEASPAPSRDRVAFAVLNALTARDRATDEAETRRLAELLEGWFGKGMPASARPYVRACAQRLPADAAGKFVGKYFAGPARADSNAAFVVRLIRPEDVGLLRAALDNVDADAQSRLLGDAFTTSSAERDTRLAMARLLPTLVDRIEASSLAYWARRLAPQLRPEEAIPLVVDLVARDPNASWTLIPTEMDGDWPDDGVYRRDILVPALPRIGEGFPDRGVLVLRCLRLLSAESPKALGEERSKELAAFLLPRLPEMDDYRAKQGYPIVADYPELFPLGAWLPKSPPFLWDTRESLGIDQARLDQAAKALVAEPAKVTDTVLTFLDNCVSGEVEAECAGQLYRKADEALLRMLVAHRHLRPDPKILEETFDRLAGADLEVVTHLGFLLAEVRPSERLFKLAERLLASPDRSFVLEGITLARSLGRDEMLQPLLGKLDSMDSDVRTQAREAIDSILELKRIKDEVSDRIKSRKLEEAGFK